MTDSWSTDNWLSTFGQLVITVYLVIKIWCVCLFGTKEWKLYDQQVIIKSTIDKLYMINNSSANVQLYIR